MNILDRLDNYYYSRKSNEVWMIVILLSILFGYILYTLLGDGANEYKTQQLRKNQELHQTITSAKSFLKSITVNGDREFYIKDLNRKIVEAKRNLNSLREKLAKIDSAKHKLKEVLYNKGNWSKFLHSIATKADKNDLHLYALTNTPVDQNRSFGKILDIHIKAQGEYANIISFINELEETKLVTNITAINLKATKTNPIADINMSVWGIKE